MLSNLKDGMGSQALVHGSPLMTLRPRLIFTALSRRFRVLKGLDVVQVVLCAEAREGLSLFTNNVRVAITVS